ncbi:hypothetical protein ACQY0O_003721 [Thecaphora frezii]
MSLLASGSRSPEQLNATVGLSSPSHSDASERGRDRIIMACVHCRKRKSKCDGTRPTCGPCNRAGRSCRYEPVCESDSWAAKMRKKRDRQRNAAINLAMEAARSRQALIEAMYRSGTLLPERCHPSSSSSSSPLSLSLSPLALPPHAGFGQPPQQPHSHSHLHPHPYQHAHAHVHPQSSAPRTFWPQGLVGHPDDGLEAYNMGLGLWFNAQGSQSATTSPTMARSMTMQAPDVTPLPLTSEWTSVMPPSTMRSPMTVDAPGTPGSAMSCRFSLSSYSSCSSLSSDSSFQTRSLGAPGMAMALQPYDGVARSEGASPLQGQFTPLMTPEAKDDGEGFWRSSSTVLRGESEVSTPVAADEGAAAACGGNGELGFAASVMALSLSLDSAPPAYDASFANTLSSAMPMATSLSASALSQPLSACSNATPWPASTVASPTSSTASSSLYAALQFNMGSTH